MFMVMGATDKSARSLDRSMLRRNTNTAIYGLAIFAAVVSNASHAAVRWETRAGITPSISVTDNVCLEKDGEKVGWTSAMAISPSGSISAKTRRSEMSLDGTINMNSLTNSYLKSKDCNGNYEDRSQYNPTLNGFYKTAFLADKVKFNSKVTMKQNEISSRYAGAEDEFNRTGNSNTFMRYTLTPSVGGRIGTLVNSNASYTWDEVINENDLVRDSNRHRVSLRFSSAWKSDWSHSVNGSWSRTQYDENILGIKQKDTELSAVRYKLGYRLRNWVRVSAAAGKSFNKYQTFTNKAQDGNAWTADIEFTPRPTTSLIIGLEDRFFGQYPKIDFRHQAKLNQIAFSYRQRLTFRRDLRTEQDDVFDFFDENNLEDVSNPSDFSTLPLIDERLSGRWVYNSAKTILSLTGSLSKQERTVDGRVAEFKSVDLTYRPKRASVMNLSATLGWREDEPIERIVFIPDFDDENQSELWTFSVTSSRPLGRRGNLALTYRFTDRDSDTGSGSYQENRITVSAGINF